MAVLVFQTHIQEAQLHTQAAVGAVFIKALRLQEVQAQAVQVVVVQVELQAQQQLAAQIRAAAVVELVKPTAQVAQAVQESLFCGIQILEQLP
jgi:hypothetical protein